MKFLDWAATAQLKSLDHNLADFAELKYLGKAQRGYLTVDDEANYIDELGFDTWIVHKDGGWIAFASQVHDNMDKGNFYVQVDRDDAWFKTLNEAQIYLWENHSKHEVGATS